jgi:hypothetical protein
MDGDTIRGLAARGKAAGERLVEHFADGDAWENHRWVRFRSYMAMIEKSLTDAADAYERDGPNTRSYRAMLHAPITHAPSYPLDRAGQAAWGRRQADQLMDVAEQWIEAADNRTTPSFSAGAPTPAPVLRAHPFL